MAKNGNGKLKLLDYEEAAKTFLTELEEENIVGYTKYVCQLLDEENIYSRFDLKAGTAWTVDSFSNTISAGMGVALDAQRRLMVTRKPRPQVVLPYPRHHSSRPVF